MTETPYKSNILSKTPNTVKKGKKPNNSPFIVKKQALDTLTKQIEVRNVHDYLEKNVINADSLKVIGTTAPKN